jgi:pimeloyl-ACP methyl ester carboxylesterase
VSGIEETTVEVGGVEVFVRRLPGAGTPSVLAHGSPTHSEDYMAILERMEGPAITYDMPGYGRSERPDRLFAMDDYVSFHDRVLETLGVDRHRLLVHDWGVIALIAALRRPERVERLLVINGLPILPGYRWHITARLWRRRGVGEILNRMWSRPAAALALRPSRGDRGKVDPEFVDLVYDHLDTGTRRQILSLYRSAPEEALAAAGEDLGELSCPALVMWGMKDPYIPSRFGAAWARAIPGARLEELPGLGHWPWWEDRSVADRAAAFLEA